MALILPGNVASATAAVGYDVANSVRFNKGDAPALKRDSMGTATDTKKWTLSMWVKRSTTAQAMLASFDGAKSYFQFQSGGQLEVNNVPGASFDYRLVTNALYRDVGAWMHIVVAYDSTQGTASNRIKLYVNGSQPSLSVATYPDEDFDAEVNSTGSFKYGSYDDSSDFAFNGYMAELVFIDGTQYAASDFGEFNSDSPTIWQPVDPSGLTFGTNGHYLDFEASGNLGNDVNGGTDFDENNIAATDQATDTPTNNFATWNVLDHSQGNSTFSEGSCKIAFSSGDYMWTRSSIGMSAGKWYGEFKNVTDQEHSYVAICVDGADDNSTYIGGGGGAAAGVNDEFEWGYKTSSGDVWNDASEASYGDTYGVNDIISVALDLDNNKLYFAKNGTWQNSGDPTSGATGTGAVSITAPASTSTGFYFFAVADGTSASAGGFEANFGGSPSFTVSSGNADGNGYGNMEYAVPANYYVLNSKNLAEYG